VFRQVVEAVWYLNRQGIIHCDIKDENILVDAQLRVYFVSLATCPRPVTQANARIFYLQVKLIDFGSAVIEDLTKPRPFYDVFYGTTAYASSEVLRKQGLSRGPGRGLDPRRSAFVSPYGKPLRSRRKVTLLKGRMRLKAEDAEEELEQQRVLGLMRMCLEPEPDRRATVEEVRNHRWLTKE
jgi:serine/threonine protein kinase